MNLNLDKCKVALNEANILLAWLPFRKVLIYDYLEEEFTFILNNPVQSAD